RRHPGGPDEPDVHAAHARQSRPLVLPPGLRRQRELRGHHDHRREDRDGRPAAHHRGRAEGSPGGQCRLPPRARPDRRWRQQRCWHSLTQEGGIGMSRYLVIGDPVVTLGAGTLIPDGALIVEDDSVVRAGPRAELENYGPFDKVLGSARHFVMPGFVNCHYHSELAIGPGLYQYIYERAHVYVGSALGPIAGQDLYNAILWGLVTAIKGGETGTVDMFYGRPSLTDFGTPAALQAYEDAGMRTMFGLVCRDQNTIVHEEDEAFLRRLPPELADEVRRFPMGLAWPLDQVFGTYDTLLKQWHGRQGRIQIAAAPDWTPACSDELYLRCHRLATEHDTGMVTH